MKKMITFFALLLTVSAFAQDQVELTSKKVSINASEAIVVRTNQTPETVEIKFQIPMAKQICERYETRYVVKQDPICGTDVRTYRDSRPKCVERNEKGKCTRTVTEVHVRTVRHVRSCPVAETYCAQYGTAVITEPDTMKIRFKGLPALADSEQETFQIKANQKNYDGENVVYTVKPVQTLREYKVKQKKFLGFKIDSYVVEEK